MKKIVCFLMSCLLLVSLAACAGGTATSSAAGDSGTPATSAAGSSGTAAETPAEDVTGDIVWTMWGAYDPEQVQAMFTDQFNERHAGKITATFEPIASNYEDKLRAMIIAGNAPDLFYYSNFVSPSVIYGGMVEDLKPYLDKSSVLSLDMFTNPEEMFKIASHNGGIYGIPPDDNPYVVYFNADMFRAAGMKTPLELSEAGEWNYNKFVESIYEISSKNQGGKYGLFMPKNWRHFYLFLLQNGGDYFTEDGSASAVNSPQVKEVIGQMKKMQDDGVLVTDMIASDNAIAGPALFMGQQSAMVIHARSYVVSFDGIEDFDWDVVPFPAKDGSPLSMVPGFTYLMMNAKSQYKDAAWTFMEEFVGPDGQMFRVAEGRGAISSLNGLNEKILTGERAPKNDRIWIDLAKIAKWTPITFGKYPESIDITMNGIEEVFAGAKTVDEGLDELAEKVNAFLAEQVY